MIAALIALFAHEAAHALMALARGLRIKGAGISRKGLYVRREAGTAADTVSIALAGPLVNLLLAAALWHVDGAARVNLALALVNLLPFVKHSDGSRALAAWRAE